MATEIVAGNSLELDYDPPATDPLRGRGQGRNVAAVTGQTVFNLPAAPTGLTLTAGDTEITASWTAPPDGGSAITGYRVEWRIADSETDSQTWDRGRDGPAVRRARLLPVHDHRRHRLRRQPHQRHLLHGAASAPSTTSAPAPERRGAGRPLRGLPAGGPQLFWGDTRVLVRWIPPAGVADDDGVLGWLVQWKSGTEDWHADRQISVDKFHDVGRRRQRRLAQLRGARREPDQRHRVRVPGPGPRRGGPHRRVDRGGVHDALASSSRCRRDRRDQTGIWFR